MLTEPIMHESIMRLLSQGDEESLECLSNLLKTMEGYFTQIQKILDKHSNNSKVRFKLEDVTVLKREVVAVSVATAPEVPQSQADEQPLSPAAIVNSELLNTIPLPGETLSDNSPQSDISLVEQQSDSSSVSPTIENEDKENVDDPAQNKTKQSNKLKYSYKEDQWSPVNIEGKKQYDRDFLLQLQCQPSSLVKPQNLPNLDVIKDKAHIQKLNEVNRQVQQQMSVMPNFRDHFLPTFAQRGVPRMPQMNNYTNRRSLQGRDSKTKKVISLSQNVKLHEADNAWKPLYKQDAGSDQIDLDKEKLKRSVQGILNKLTPQKFETLLTQVKNLNIDTEEKLCTVIDLIFEKAVNEPNFIVPYANMCKHLALEKKKELEQEIYDEEKKGRYMLLGNIRFIGELFKLGMITKPIMHECIEILVFQEDEESLECLSQLLKTIGKELHDREVEGCMEGYFTQMQNIVDKRLTGSRVRFMLQDVIDLKRNDWVPRREENNPKIIDRIHKEAEREAQHKLKGPEYNIDRMEIKARLQVEEFLVNNDFEEAIRCVTELASLSTIHLFINAAINQVLERSSQARHSLGQLLFNLVKQNIITFDHYKKGFEVVLESIDEFELDFPMIREYIGEILEPILEDNKFTLGVLKDVLKPCIPSQTAGLLVSATLHCAARRRGTIKLGQQWRESELQWTDFLGDDAKVDEFILKHKLEFTIYPTKVKPTTPMSIEDWMHINSSTLLPFLFNLHS